MGAVKHYMMCAEDVFRKVFRRVAGYMPEEEDDYVEALREFYQNGSEYDPDDDSDFVNHLCDEPNWHDVYDGVRQAFDWGFQEGYELAKKRVRDGASL